MADPVIVGRVGKGDEFEAVIRLHDGRYYVTNITYRDAPIKFKNSKTFLTYEQAVEYAFELFDRA